MRLNERQQLIALVAVFALVVIGEGLYAYSCLTTRGELHAKLNELEQEEKAARVKIAKIGELRKQSAELAQIIEEYAEILPTEREVGTDAFLEDIEGFMEGTSLIMVTGAPVEQAVRRDRKNQTQTEKSNFVQHKYRFELEGTYADIMKFVNRVENHTRFLEFVKTDIRSIGAVRGRVNEQEEVELAANPRKAIEVIISTYTYSKKDAKPAAKQ